MRQNQIRKKLGIIVTALVIASITAAPSALAVSADEITAASSSVTGSNQVPDSSIASSSAGAGTTGTAVPSAPATPAPDAGNQEGGEIASPGASSETAESVPESSVSSSETGTVSSSSSASTQSASGSTGASKSSAVKENGSSDESSGNKAADGQKDTDGLTITDTAGETPASDLTGANGGEAEGPQRAPTGSRTVVPPEYLKMSNLRFETVGKHPVFAAEDMNIYMSTSTSSQAVGHITKNGIMYRLKDEGNGWLYVESGEVRGFIPASSIRSEVAAKHLMAARYRLGNAHTDEEKAEFDWSPYFASKTVEIWDNEAFTHTNTTTRETIAEKHDLLTLSAVNITEQPDANSTVIGTIPANGLLYKIENAGSEWLYVESGDCRGFVPWSSVRGGREVNAEVAAAGESSFAGATEKVSPKDNRAFYYSLSSVTPWSEKKDLGASIIKNASYYIGNNYVWGGTSLTDGADCSGFVQTLYGEFGISLPRVAQDQAQVGTRVSLEDAVPGDLCFYRNAATGEIYHVAIYAGDGKTIEAYSSSRGIIATTVYTPDLCWCTHVFPDQTNEPATLTAGDSVIITPDTSAGGQYGYGTWDNFCAAGTTERGLKEKYGDFDAEGFGRISGRYVISCMPSFGKVGDLIDFTLSNGTVLKTIVGSNMTPSDNQWGLAGGKNAISFMVAGRTWKEGHPVPGTAGFHPEWNAAVQSAHNYGSILG